MRWSRATVKIGIFKKKKRARAVAAQRCSKQNCPRIPLASPGRPPWRRRGERLGLCGAALPGPPQGNVFGMTPQTKTRGGNISLPPPPSTVGGVSGACAAGCRASGAGARRRSAFLCDAMRPGGVAQTQKNRIPAPQYIMRDAAAEALKKGTASRCARSEKSMRPQSRRALRP